MGLCVSHRSKGLDRGGSDIYTVPSALYSLTSRLGIQQLQLVRGPHRILLTAEELTFIHQPLSRRVGGAGTRLGGQAAD